MSNLNRKIAEWMGMHVEPADHPTFNARLVDGKGREVDFDRTEELVWESPLIAFDRRPLASHLLREHLFSLGCKWAAGGCGEEGAFHALVSDNQNAPHEAGSTVSEYEALALAVERLIKAEQLRRHETISE